MVDRQTGQKRRPGETVEDSRLSRRRNHRGLRSVGVVNRHRLDVLFDYRQPRRLPLDPLARLLQKPAYIVALQMLGNIGVVQLLNPSLTRQTLGNHASNPAPTTFGRLLLVFVQSVEFRRFIAFIRVRLRSADFGRVEQQALPRIVETLAPLAEQRSLYQREIALQRTDRRLLLVDGGSMLVDRCLLLPQLCVTLIKCRRQYNSGVEHGIPSSVSNVFSITMMEIIHIYDDRVRALTAFCKVFFGRVRLLIGSDVFV